MGISLEKKSEIVRLTLEKRNIPTSVVMQVKSCIDISGSISNLFSNGTIQELVDRLLAVAVRFDDNQSLESYAFGSGAVRLSDIKPSMFGSYVNSIFLKEADRSGYLWTGTMYSKALKLIRKDSAPAASGGFLGGMFGKKAPKPMPTYLMFITDGETNGDENDTESLLKEMASELIYVQFIGVGRSNFSFLSRMGDRYDHVGFVTFPDMASTTDEAMYDTLLSGELATWIRLAQ